ncbi:MAG: cation-transporting P-type ATPase, partial [Verrucomicrobiae bacterium]|nr:cation-transporting P-type ATPase [Verrucomicrobiae bacterium]
MNLSTTPESESDDAAVSPWMQSLVEFLNQEDKVEALRVDPTKGTVSVATLGVVDLGDLQERLESLLEGLDREHLFDGAGKESAGDTALAGSFGLHLSRQQNGATLEKPSCPTAPKLWKWREFSWPEPEEIERQSREEWQTLAIQAGICGTALVAALVTGNLAGEATGGGLFLASRILFLISLIAGAWDAAIDAWEKIRERVLDIHFLMLAVAAGAVSIGAWT